MRGILIGVLIAIFSIGVPALYRSFGKPKYPVSEIRLDSSEIEKRYRESVVSEILSKLNEVEQNDQVNKLKNLAEELKENLPRDENNKLVNEAKSLSSGMEDVANLFDKLLIRYEPNPEKVSYGKKLFENWCATCHGREGDSLPITPEGLKTLLGYPIYARDFTGKYHREGKVVFKFASDYTGEFAPDEEIKRIIVEGLPGTPMPGFPMLEEKELDAILEYMKSLNPRWKFYEPKKLELPTPPPDLMSDERIERGRKQFEVVCVACHRNIEKGEEPIEQPLAWYKFDKKGKKSEEFQVVKARWFGKEPLRRGKPEYIFLTIKKGIAGTTMTPWGHLGDETIWDLVSYVLYLENKNLNAEKGGE
jgi:mono/diheme cytochrome c family protein